MDERHQNINNRKGLDTKLSFPKGEKNKRFKELKKNFTRNGHFLC